MSRVVAWSVWAAGCLLVLVGAASATGLDFTPSELPFGVAFAVLGVGAVSAGTVLIRRVPGNAVGPLLLTLGLGTGSLLTTGAYAEASLGRRDPLPGDAWAAWLSNWVSIPTFFGATVLLLLLFPDGRLVAPGWRGAAWFAATGVAAATLAAAFTPRRIAPGFVNPLGARGAAADVVVVLEDATDWVALPVLLVAVASLAVRVRRSAGVERQQLKMFALVAVIVFRPLRSRVQAVVDRRFDRRRYDAARTLETFGTRLRDELDLDSLAVDLRRVVSETMAPAHVSLWLREEPS